MTDEITTAQSMLEKASEAENEAPEETLESNPAGSAGTEEKAENEAPIEHSDTSDVDKVAEGNADSEENVEKRENPAGPLPEWAEKRFKRERRKHERETEQLRRDLAQVRQNNQVNQFGNTQETPIVDPNLYVTDPVTGVPIDRNSMEGMVIQKLEQIGLSHMQKTEAQKKQEHQRQLKQKIEKGYDKYDDFDDVVQNLNLTPQMLDVVGRSDSPADLIHELYHHRIDDVERISKLPVTQQIEEMAILKSEFKRSKNKKIIKPVSEPMAPIKGSGSIEKDPEKMSFEELMKLRRSQQRR